MADDEADARRPRRFRFAVAAWSFLVALLALAVAAAAWLSTESALQRALGYAIAQSGGRLAIEGASGSLFGTIRAKRIEFRDAGIDIVAEDVALRYALARLIDAKLEIHEVAARRVAIVSTKTDDEPLRLPDSLKLPLSVDVDRIAIERIDWRFDERAGVLESVTLKYAADANGHRVRDLHVRSAGAALTGNASIGAEAPFALNVDAALALSDPYPAGRVAATATGNLEAVSLALDASMHDIAGTARASIAPFAAQPLREAHVAARAVDIARIDASWPATSLDIDLQARGTDAGFAGRLAIANGAAGPIDANRVPLSELGAAYTFADDRLTLSDVRAALPGNARVDGELTFDVNARHARGKLRVAGLDLAKLHRSLVATALSGRIDADATERVQRVVADVSQQDMRLAFDARYDGERVIAERVSASARESVVEGKGQLALQGRRAFVVDARARRFDPARFGDFPPGSIDATLAATGALEPAPFANAKLAIASGSRIAGLAAQGRIAGRFAERSADALDVDVTLGSTRLRANGGMQRTGDRLMLAASSRRLEELVPLLPASAPKPIGGALDATATIKPVSAGLRVAVSARGERLSAGADWRFAKLSLDARALYAGPLTKPDPEALRDVVLEAELSGASTPAGTLASGRARLTGSAASHVLALTASEADMRVEARIAGAVANLASTPVWRGSVESLDTANVAGVDRVVLQSPAAVELAADRVVVGAARLQGAGTDVEVDGFSWRNGAIETRGRFRGLPVAMVAKQAGVALRWPVDVTLGGAWDVISRPSWHGTVKVARERGDIYVEQPDDASARIALGLETLAIDATLDGGRVRGNAEMRARLGGTALAEFDIAAPAGAAHPFVDGSSLRASVRAHLPSLATLQPWVGTAARVQGQLIADVAVAGTIAKPALSGQLVGYGLRVDMPQYGVNLKDGRLRVVSAADGLRVEELVFVGGEGRFTASGVLGVPGEGGMRAAATRVTWHAENFRALNHPDRRLVVDGDGVLALEDKRLAVRGKLSIDEGQIEYHSTADTTLADDIVVVGRPRPGESRRDSTGDIPLDLDLEIDLGRELRLVAEGVNARLAGRVHVTSQRGGPLQAKGTVRAVRGTYYAFGQRLDIDRARLVFDGPFDNPALDIVALRKNLAVEAGVEITGTVRVPIVRLTSNPPVPDSEKLSWLLTGGPSGGDSQREALALQAATAALFGQGSGKPFTQKFAERVGLDDIQLVNRNTAPASSTAALGGQMVSLGKRINDRLYVAFEQGIELASNALRVEYVLSRYVTVSAYAGTNSGVALNFRRNWR
jgi:translocation and assembly module TamB